MSNKKVTGRCSFVPSFLANELRKALSRDLGGGTTNCARIDVQKPVQFGDVETYFVERQINEFTKKFVDPTRKNPEARTASYNKFNLVVEHLSGFGDLSLPTPGSFISRREGRRPIILLRARNLFREILGEVDFTDFVCAVKNGSGTTQGVAFTDTSDVARFTYPITTTTKQLSLFRSILKLWPQLEQSIVAANDGKPLEFKICYSSRATTVPKTTDVERMIAIETTVGMFLQQGLMAIMYDKLRSFGLDLASLQDKHKELALIYSLTRKGATVDFASASDCVLTQIVRFFASTSWFYLLDICRTDGKLALPIEPNDPDSDFRVIDMPMFSTMGNATTFPIETLVFYVIAHCIVTDDGTQSHYSPTCDKLDSVSVFGDDCILPTVYSQTFIQVCESIGFLVNTEKSFFNESSAFRESCGADYLLGRNVRPVYLREPTGTRISDLESWLYTVFNGFQQRYISFFGPLTYLYNSYLFDKILSIMDTFGIRPCVVPSHFPDDAGLKLIDDLDRWLLHYPLLQSSILPSVSTHGSIIVHYKTWQYHDPSSHAPASLSKKKIKQLGGKGTEAYRKEFSKYEKALKSFRHRRKLADQIGYALALRRMYQDDLRTKREFLVDDIPSWNGRWFEFTSTESLNHAHRLVWDKGYRRAFTLRRLFGDADTFHSVYERKRKGGYVVARAVVFDALLTKYQGYSEYLDSTK